MVTFNSHSAMLESHREELRKLGQPPVKEDDMMRVEDALPQTMKQGPSQFYLLNFCHQDIPCIRQSPLTHHPLTSSKIQMCIGIADTPQPAPSCKTMIRM
jgi:hypothetical protein